MLSPLYVLKKFCLFTLLTFKSIFREEQKFPELYNGFSVEGREKWEEIKIYQKRWWREGGRGRRAKEGESCFSSNSNCVGNSSYWPYLFVCFGFCFKALLLWTVITLHQFGSSLGSDLLFFWPQIYKNFEVLFTLLLPHCLSSTFSPSYTFLLSIIKEKMF